MTTPESPTGGPARPARIAGIVLLVVAAIALVMGVISLLPLGGGNNAASSSTPPPASATSSASSAKPTTTTPAPTTTSTTTANPPTTTTTAPAQQTTGGNNPQSVSVRVYNNGTIHGLAQQAADDFRAAGWNVTSVGPYSQGIIATTTVYFRPGTDEEAAANSLGQAFHMRVMPRFDGIQAATPGVIVIITNDFSPPAKG
jgi:LytR cell envelope-related transcriptional attenuator